VKSIRSFLKIITATFITNQH